MIKVSELMKNGIFESVSFQQRQRGDVLAAPLRDPKKHSQGTDTAEGADSFDSEV